MQKEIVSTKMAICTMMLFVFGTSAIIGVYTNVGQDSWIAFLISIFMIVPMILVYARIIQLYPEKDICEVMEILFGKVFGKVLQVAILWYGLHLASLVIRNFTEYIEIITLPQTPRLPIMISLLLISVYLAKSGIEVLGRWSVICIFMITLIVIFTFIFSIEDMKIINLQPFLEYEREKILNSSFQLFSFPLGEIVIFLSLTSSLKKNANPYKVFLYGTIGGALVILTIIFRNTLVLGKLMNTVNFSSYVEARIINVSTYISRLEGFITFNFILAGITKISICILSASKIFSRLFNLKDYRKIIFPIGLLALALCGILYENVTEMFEFLNIYKYYAFPFQVIIPLMVWIAAEIKHKNKKMFLQHYKKMFRPKKIKQTSSSN